MIPTIIGREPELARLHQLATVTGIRSILFMTGPSGIGKTTLAKAVGMIEDLNLIYIPYYEQPRTLRETIEIIRDSLRNNKYNYIKQIAENLTLEVLEKTTRLNLKSILSRSEERRIIYKILTEIVEKLEKLEKITVIVLDEAQNLLKGLQGIEDKWQNIVWSFIKALSSIQEQSMKVKFLVVTSDYFFHEDVFMHAPSLDYVDTYYLGELVRSDAERLYYYLRNTEPGDLIDYIGGKPAQIREITRYPRPKERLCSITRRFLNALQQRIVSIPRRYRNEVIQFLDSIASEPKPLSYYYEMRSRLEGSGLRVLEWLVDNDVLQFSCRPYTGVYSWNEECTSDNGNCGGGGVCGGLDSVAASSRPALAAIVALLTSLGIETEAPAWATGLAKSCGLL